MATHPLSLMTFIYFSVTSESIAINGNLDAEWKRSFSALVYGQSRCYGIIRIIAIYVYKPYISPLRRWKMKLIESL